MLGESVACRLEFGECAAVGAGQEQHVGQPEAQFVREDVAGGAARDCGGKYIGGLGELSGLGEISCLCHHGIGLGRRHRRRACGCWNR